ncbi:MAG: hypothetical protein HYU74_12575 [Dechloromonas sp.]|nr:hypothetical protein [Dechloromonas sp.]
MTTRNRKHPPQSLQQALEACIEQARTKHRRSIENIAADMGLPNHWSLYKWVESGRLPAVLIRPFELACRCDAVTRFLAHAAHRLVIDIPTGKRPQQADLHVVQAAGNEAMTALLAFAAGKLEAAEVIEAVTVAMEQLAYQRENVARNTEPELELEGAQ